MPRCLSNHRPWSLPGALRPPPSEINFGLLGLYLATGPPARTRGRSQLWSPLLLVTDPRDRTIKLLPVSTLEVWVVGGSCNDVPAQTVSVLREGVWLRQTLRRPWPREEESLHPPPDMQRKLPVCKWLMVVLTCELTVSSFLSVALAGFDHFESMLWLDQEFSLLDVISLAQWLSTAPNVLTIHILALH